MSSPRSVDLLRLEAMAVSAPKTKRAKRIKTIPVLVPPEPEPPVITCTNLRDLPSELMVEVLDFLRPDPDLIRPMHKYCGMIAISQVSKYFRALALSNQVWYRICVIRWTTKVSFATRLAMADAEADTANPLIRGGFWYRKFVIEEDDALRSTISRDELHNTTFSIRLWFNSKYQAETNPNSNKRKLKGMLSSGLDCPSVSDIMRFLPGGSLSGLPELYDGESYEMNKSGSIINFGMLFEDEDATDPFASLHVLRRSDWGWELRSNLYVIRSVEHIRADGLWDELCIVPGCREEEEGGCYQPRHHYQIQPTRSSGHPRDQGVPFVVICIIWCDCHLARGNLAV